MNYIMTQAVVFRPFLGHFERSVNEMIVYTKF